jgi:hypothetical protein
MIFAKRLPANIALTTVILAGAMLIASGMGILYSAIDISIASKSLITRSQVESKMTSCIEESLRKITRNPNYVGSFSVSFTDGSCTGTVAIDPITSTKRNLTINATYLGGYTLTRTKVVDTSTSPYTLTNF